MKDYIIDIYNYIIWNNIIDLKEDKKFQYNNDKRYNYNISIL